MIVSEVEESILDRDIADLVAEKYSAFAISSNARAIPDLRDGMKPVYRRILFTAKQVAPSSRGTVKSASIVGQALAFYHPHGNVSVYDAMARMTKDYINNIPYIHGQGKLTQYS